MYTKLLQKYDIQISMSEKGDPLENAIAERVNGILKEEYLSHHNIKNLSQAKRILQKSVFLYNTQRPHMSIGNYTPEEIHHALENRKIITTKKHLRQPILGFNKKCQPILGQDIHFMQLGRGKPYPYNS